MSKTFQEVLGEQGLSADQVDGILNESVGIALVSKDQWSWPSIGMEVGKDFQGRPIRVGQIVGHTAKSGRRFVGSPFVTSYDGSPASNVMVPGSGEYTQRHLKTKVFGDGSAMPILLAPTDQVGLATVEWFGMPLGVGTGAKKVVFEPKKIPSIEAILAEGGFAAQHIGQPSTPKASPAPPKPVPPPFPVNADSPYDLAGLALHPGDPIKWAGMIEGKFLRAGVTVGTVPYHYIEVAGAEHLVTCGAIARIGGAQ